MSVPIRQDNKLANKMMNIAYEDLKKVRHSKSGGYYQSFGKLINVDLIDDSSTFAIRGQGAVFLHEYGHFVDDVIGSKTIPKIVNGKRVLEKRVLSEDPRLLNAVKKDLKKFLDGVTLDVSDKRYYNDLIKSDKVLVNKHASKRLLRQSGNGGSTVSDVFGGLTNNKVRGGFGHSSDYWSRGDTDKEVTSELFAGLHAAQFSPSALAVIDEMLPNSYKAFIEIMEEAFDTLADVEASKTFSLIK